MPRKKPVPVEPAPAASAPAPETDPIPEEPLVDDGQTYWEHAPEPPPLRDGHGHFAARHATVWIAFEGQPPPFTVFRHEKGMLAHIDAQRAAQAIRPGFPIQYQSVEAEVRD